MTTTQNPAPTVPVRVQSYDEASDIYTLACGYDFDKPETLARDWVDFDDFNMPGLLLPALGIVGEPHEIVGQVFDVQLP